MCRFWDQNSPIALNEIFSEKRYNFDLPLGLDCAKLTKNLYSISRVMTMHNFWAQNDPFSHLEEFFWENHY